MTMADSNIGSGCNTLRKSVLEPESVSLGTLNAPYFVEISRTEKCAKHLHLLYWHCLLLLPVVRTRSRSFMPRRPRHRHSLKSRNGDSTMDSTRQAATLRRDLLRMSIGIRDSVTHPCLRQPLRTTAMASAKAISGHSAMGPRPRLRATELCREK